jgi:hypothetical protein
MSYEFREKEELFMKIMMENAGPEVEALLSNIDYHSTKQGIVKEYLKNKENELSDSIQATVISNLGSSQTNKKGVAAKQEVKKAKEQTVQQSKIQMSKRIAEMDRKQREDEKKMESLKHRLE